MSILFFDEADAFLARTEALLEQAEAENNIILGIAQSLKRNPKEINQEMTFLAVQKQEKLLACGLCTPPRPLNLFAPPEVKPEAFLPQLIVSLQRKKAIIPGVNAPSHIAKAFAEAWCNAHDCTFELKLHSKVYRLDHLSSVPPVSGHLRKMHIGDLLTLQKWMHEFSLEAMGIDEADQAMQHTLKKFEREELYVWEDKSIVCMAAASRPTNNGITINYVYTPPEHRQKGYASACVGALSQKMLDNGYQFCALFADQQNPTSNKIYQRMGYKALEDFMNIIFVK